MSEQWGPWIQHEGGFVPQGVRGAFLHLLFDDGDEFIGRDGVEGISRDGFTVYPSDDGWTWVEAADFGLGDDARVVRYRIRKPRGLTILEEALRDLPVEVDA